MTFANPLFLWSLLGLIPLIAIYLLKVRPNRKPTTAWFLWDEIFQEKRSSALFQRLRDLISLLLMVLAFLAIAFALAKPLWYTEDQKDLVLVIDTTASMNAVDGLGTNLDSAKRAAKGIVESLGVTQRCSIATVSDRVRYVSNLTDNPRDLLDAIDQIKGTDIPFRQGALDEFADSPAANTVPEDADQGQDGETPSREKLWRAILISDGVVPDIPAGLELFAVGGESSGNVGIVACDIQRLPGAERASVFIQLASSFSKSVDAEIELFFDQPENIVKLIPTTIEPGINKAFSFELEGAKAGCWQLNLAIDDAMDSDNRCFLVLHPVEPIAVRVAAQERFFYENSVLAFSSSGGLLNLVTQGGQIMISQGAESETADDSKTPDGLLIFAPEGNASWWDQTGEEIEVQLPRAIDENHPVIRHIDVTSIPFVGARRVSLPQAAQVLVEAEDGTPLIWQMSKADKSAVVVNLDPLDSNFYFSAWFPIMVYSSATHLSGRSEELKSTWPTGEIAQLPGNNQQPGALTYPDGHVISIDSRKVDLPTAGHYLLEEGSQQWQLASSLLSVQETMIDKRDTWSNLQPLRRGWSPVTWLTMLAIVVLTAESVLYQRRKVG